MNNTFANYFTTVQIHTRDRCKNYIGTVNTATRPGIAFGANYHDYENLSTAINGWGWKYVCCSSAVGVFQAQITFYFVSRSHQAQQQHALYIVTPNYWYHPVSILVHWQPCSDVFWAALVAPGSVPFIARCAASNEKSAFPVTTIARPSIHHYMIARALGRVDIHFH